VLEEAAKAHINCGHGSTSSLNAHKNCGGSRGNPLALIEAKMRPSS